MKREAKGQEEMREQRQGSEIVPWEEIVTGKDRDRDRENRDEGFVISKCNPLCCWKKSRR